MPVMVSFFSASGCQAKAEQRGSRKRSALPSSNTGIKCVPDAGCLRGRRTVPEMKPGHPVPGCNPEEFSLPPYLCNLLSSEKYRQVFCRRQDPAERTPDPSVLYYQTADPRCENPAHSHNHREFCCSVLLSFRKIPSCRLASAAAGVYTEHTN